ncbi:PAS domain-containing protein [Cochlodiniinecator piscidefendens]|uniref:PAS domain-containing protein n=1 Tax=Cochlodiniinecator piscidefendens TaxID=2715756 RepID=UPI00140C34B3|nr:PAS domain-containing protein [Cochlodiniinecator piscidefendens]
MTHYGHNIISMVDYQDLNRFPALKQIEAYWEGLRNGNDIPSRSEIDPRGIQQLLEHTFVLERIAPGLARFRIAGMHLVDLMGMEVRGMPLSAFFTPDARAIVSDVLERAFSGPEIVELTLYAEKGIGKPPMDGKMIFLPLKNDMGEVNRILGAFVTEGPIGRAGRRFHIETTKARHVHVDSHNAEDVPQSVIGFAEDHVAFEEKKPDTTRPALRLVKSDD